MDREAIDEEKLLLSQTVNEAGHRDARPKCLAEEGKSGKCGSNEREGS